MSDPARARALFSDPELGWLVERLVARVRGGQPLSGRLRLSHASPEQREALARLTGEYGRGAGLSVDLAALERQLVEAGVAGSLQEVVEVLAGPIVPRAILAAEQQAAWEAVFEGVEGPGWEDLRRNGLLRRLAGGDPELARTLVTAARDLCAALPAAGLPLQALAARTGDAHALDAGRPLGTLLLRLIAARTGVDPEDRRLCWAAVGVELDPVSSSVLALGLRARGDGLVARLLAACADAGEPCRLTLRQLRGGVEVDGSVVFVCENPAVVVAAADRLGSRCAPLVCVEGQPGSAALAVLDAVGPRARYHGDFDWPGLRIAASVLARTGGQPWRYDAAAYAAAPKGLELSGNPAPTPWDPALARVMAREGLAVHEEAVLEGLLEDLGGHASDHRAGRS